MMEDVRARWTTLPWSAVRAEVLATNRPTVDRWDETNMNMPWPEDLRGIDLGGHRVADAVLYFWNMDLATIEGAILARCFILIDGPAPSFRRVVLENCSTGLWNAPGFQARELRSHHGRFDASSFRDATLVGAMFDHDDWSSSKFVSTDLTGARFTACNLHSVRVHGSNLTDATFEDCDMRAAEFSDVSLRGARLLRCDLRDATLDGVDLSHTDVTGSRFSLPSELPPNPYLGR